MFEKKKKKEKRRKGSQTRIKILEALISRWAIFISWIDANPEIISFKRRIFCPKDIFSGSLWIRVCKS